MKFEELATHFENTKKKAEGILFWYSRKRKSFRTFSQLIRLVTVIMAGIGGVMPLIELAFPGVRSINFVNFGYVAFSLAASLFLLDRFFGFSSGWMRFMLAEIRIRNILSQKENSWVLYQLRYKDSEVTQEVADEMVEFINELSESVNLLTLNETNEWINEFKSANQSLEQLTNTKKVSGPAKIK
ncbi:MAG: SLATT domain-containing protein [Cyclobacteriaceae bacterium]